MKRFGYLLPMFAVLWLASPSCGDDDPAAPELGKSGETCQSRSDCSAGLGCFNNVCTPEGQGSDDASVDSAPPVVRSQRGESCAARIDCVLGLTCINNVCADAQAGAEAGQSGVGERGESCRSRGDCAPALACVGGVCSKVDFGITPTNKECAVLACTVAKDCCPKVVSPSCPVWEAQCGDAGPTNAFCALFRTNCLCSEESYVCTPDNKCATRGTCNDASSLCAPGFVCKNGTECVRCVRDLDCLAGQTCTPQNTCATTCKDTKDCAYLQTCQAGACVDITGCTTDRECVAQSATNNTPNPLPPNPLAVCKSGRCKVPCETDLQCYVGNVYQYRACVNGSCEDIGCTTDEECRFRLKQPATANSNTTVVCRERRDGGM